MKRSLLTILAAATVAAAIGGCSRNSGPLAPAEEGAAASGDKRAASASAMYEIVIENLTPATGAGASQPFSPPILAVHDGSASIFAAGEAATPELALVAEDAVNQPLVDLLAGSRHVRGLAVGDGVILPGGTATYRIDAGRGGAFLSGVFMLVNTNDAFGGIDRMRLPQKGEAAFTVMAWDAGSEANSEAAADIPGPCCGSPGMGQDTHEPVRRHAGITGAGDLDPAVYGWEGPVARVTVRRLP